MNLKFHLLLNIALVGSLCLIGTAAYVLYQAQHEARTAARASADSIGRQLELQWLRVDAGFDHPARFPDLDLWKETRQIPGICVQFKARSGALRNSVCHGADFPGEKWPGWFEKSYRLIFGSSPVETRVIRYHHRTLGTLRVLPDSRLELAHAWEKLATLFQLSATTLLSLCLLVYIAICRSLRPTQCIVAALEKMRLGALDTRVPEFAVREWQLTAEAINGLARAQQALLAERKHLSLKLVRLQEQERRELARELHDESGQCLAASNAVAASILHTAKTDCPSLVPEIENILGINRTILDRLQTMLLRLRPAELDELGLQSCLNSMVMEWNARARGKTTFRLRVEGGCDQLPDPLPVTLYRIVQECLTNIAKHANATQVSIQLAIGSESVRLEVENDGGLESEPCEKSGIGLLGIRERVIALDGDLCLSSSQTERFVLQATIPLNPRPITGS